MCAREIMACASWSGWHAGISSPLDSCCTSDGLPPTAVAITGSPHDIISRIAFDMPSVHEARRPTSSAGSTDSMSGRMPIKVTRTLLAGVLDGSLKDADFRTDPYFGFKVPTEVPGVPAKVLVPRNTWDDPSSYDTMAKDLAARFQDYMVQFEDKMTDEVKAAAPRA